MTLDRFIHKVKCILSPSYRRERREATKQLLANLQASRDAVISHIEKLLQENSSRYGEMRARELYSPEEARRIEKKMFFQYRQLQAIKAGRKSTDIDVKSFLDDIFLTSDALMEKYGYPSTNPRQDSP